MPVEAGSVTTKGLMIAAPLSGAGKTTLTLALLRALKDAGRAVVSAKSGPDYIDPRFHQAASGKPCVNLDAWAMTPETLSYLALSQAGSADLMIVEAAMGLFDGAASGKGSAADLAVELGIPVVLVIDCAKQAQSVAALVHGFRTFRSDIDLAGVILNRVGSTRHEKMLRDALAPHEVEVLGAVEKSGALSLPERHLGLVQANEHPDLEAFLKGAADICRDRMDLELFLKKAAQLRGVERRLGDLPEPLGQRIAVAQDVAFAFAYPHLLNHWLASGAELSFFSPLADEAPDKEADAIFLPGGYPELHAGKLAGAAWFFSGMSEAAKAGRLIYGECGGYMTLGDGMIDAEGTRHRMLGLLPLETSFKARKRHLGYRKLRPLNGSPWTRLLTAHEFHYASILSEGKTTRLFAAEDAAGNPLGDLGQNVGSVSGSFAHVIASS
ncbi:cobyrinate a,c-diamide synthase [uncultured Roseibium sp.]|uniref:cobyrinate a,c-diamide synthase n=1 Tax=uncultured Roseibium sp. TaxID=1936171 RepID=UPI002630DCFC|nr:cobyrinate a,c-diamide synthase [uncultured Roseibium sp.]